jgi:hypothetical protein
VKHVIKINQPDFVGSTVIAFDDEGKARAAVDLVNGAGDGRTSAEYLGQGAPLHLTFLAKLTGEPTLRAQAIEAYERALPHRQAYDVLDLKPTEAHPGEYSCYILGGFRPKVAS